nr:MAG TPA: hypothetical protein [Bacteriophage sp.]DAT55924.1 MAG TPA: hypothetical protein [Caudoviricetes sp.]
MGYSGTKEYSNDHPVGITHFIASGASALWCCYITSDVSEERRKDVPLPLYSLLCPFDDNS